MIGIIVGILNSKLYFHVVFLIVLFGTKTYLKSYNSTKKHLKLNAMKRFVLILAVILPLSFFAQSSRDINTVIQKTLDLHALKNYFNDDEKAGNTPIIIINDDKIPNNLIVFKFDKRVKVMTFEEMEVFRSVYQGNLDSYFIFEVMDFTDDNQVTIKATFRKNDKIAINVNMKKENNNWIVTESKAG